MFARSLNRYRMLKRVDYYRSAVGAMRTIAGVRGVNSPGVDGMIFHTCRDALSRCQICGPLITSRRCASDTSKAIGADRFIDRVPVRKKRQNIKRAKPQTKRERMVSPARTGEVQGYSIALNERLPQMFESKINSIRDYAQSLVKSDHPRAKRVGPKMDGKWWAVNIAVALTPAVLLALYCERQKPEMEEYFRRVKEKERKRIMGDLGEYENEDKQIKEEELKFGMEQGTNALTMKARVIDAVTALFGFPSLDREHGAKGSSNGIDRPDNDANRPDVDGTNGMRDDPKNAMPFPSPTSPASATPSATSEASSESDGTPGTSESNLESIASLQRRIEALEDQLAQKATEEERRKRILEHRKRYRMERSNQSGTQNRIEDRWIDEWMEEDRKARVRKRQQADGEVNESARGEENEDALSKTFSLLDFMKNNAKQKVEILMGYGSAALDYLNGSIFSGEANIERDAVDEDNCSQKPKQSTGQRKGEGSRQAQLAEAQTSSTVALAVQEAADAALASANSTEAALGALKQNDIHLAAQRATEAASDAMLAAEAASDAAADITKVSVDGVTALPSASTPALTSTSSKEGVMGRMKAWVAKRVLRRGDSGEKE